MSNEAEKRAAKLIGEETPGQHHCDQTYRAFVKFIQRVSDLVENYMNGAGYYKDLNVLILPKPADPLVEAMAKALHFQPRGCDAEALRAELAKRGGSIVFGDE